MNSHPRVGRFALGVLTVALSVLCAACTTPHGGRPTIVTNRHRDPRPNIVFVLTDDLSSDLVRYMPHVLALERAGTSLRNNFVVDSLCCPSRTSIFTGEYPHDDGVYTNHGALGGYGAFQRHDDGAQTFALALHRAGYRTALMGKYLNDYEPADPKGPGWDNWAVAGNAYGEYDYVLNEDGTRRSFGHSPRDYLTDVLSRRAVSFIDSAATTRRPFALEVATFAPHKPYVPAPADRNSVPDIAAPRTPAFDRLPTSAPHWLNYSPLTPRDVRVIDRAYRLRVEAVQDVDRMVGRLERVLAARKLLSNTYIVFGSDNGYHLGQYRMLPGKQTAFDTDIHVPLIVSGPGVPAGHSVDAMTSMIDLAPTFEQLGHVPTPSRTDGTSMLALWHGAPTPADWQRAVLVEHHGPDDLAGDPDAQYGRAGDPPSYEAIRTRDALFVQYADGQREFYDLAHDPYELHNLASSLSPARLAAYETMLGRLRDCHGTVMCQAAARPATSPSLVPPSSAPH